MKPLLLALCFVVTAHVSAQPWTPHVIWDRSGAEDSSRYGSVILPLGDQNNDGFADWAVFAAGGAFGSTERPLLEFFHGGNPMPTQPYMTFDGVGRLAGIVGDVNGDGYMDWYDWRGLEPTYYRLSIYFGGPDADTLADWAITVTDDGGWFGSLGDFNGDGYADVFYYHNDSGDYVDMFYGGSPMDTLADWTVHSAPPYSQNAAPLSFGDLNGDGYSDFVSVRALTSTTYIFLGGVHPDTIPAYTWPNMASFPLEIVRDLNGDHYNELVYYNGEVHFGGPIMHSMPDAAVSFPCTEGNALEAVSAGDFNRDGYNDLILLRDYCSNSWWGVLSLYLGHPSLNPEPAFTIEGLTPPLNLHSIQTAANLGDVNGDHIDDLAIGAWDDLDYAGWRGRAVILAGDSTLRAAADNSFILPPSSFILSVYPNPFNSTAVFSFSLPRVANVELKVYDVTGRLVQTLSQGRLQAGEHDIRLDAGEWPSGIYFARMEAGGAARVQKMVLIR